ncbi:ribbon-helix-helix protein, CopG family [Gammaproteobacteria bacterium AB-CW1]|uniref:Ribbon-helix-helix protein, CopG family n=1 Tax=Natronospira elongata TaxID=3110268 RepID=A0AAP6JG65_9GAMM|nr:ribbon-helix-helix protein, CopG family [Gammaproteobacteria bacterium AB-CW1]
MLNVRLPQDLEARLEAEARRSQRSRSALVRDAIGAYLAERERQRFMEAMGRAARAVGDDASSARESREMAEAFLDLENEVSEPPGEYDAGDPWWR